MTDRGRRRLIKSTVYTRSKTFNSRTSKGFYVDFHFKTFLCIQIRKYQHLQAVYMYINLRRSRDCLLLCLGGNACVCVCVCVCGFVNAAN